MMLRPRLGDYAPDRPAFSLARSARTGADGDEPELPVDVTHGEAHRGELVRRHVANHEGAVCVEALDQVRIASVLVGV
jgi:hypothetical protein